MYKLVLVFKTEWFSSVYDENLETRTDLGLVESIILEAGQHRYGGIPCWKDKQDSVSDAICVGKLHPNEFIAAAGAAHMLLTT